MKISIAWKERLARTLRWPFMAGLMRLAVQLVVPRQRVGVMLLAFNEDDEVLMLRHVFHPYAPWGPPGGWMGRGESPEDGLLREVKEETGLTAIVDQVVHVEYDYDPPHMVIAYTGRVEPGVIRLSAEILEAAWFAPDALPEPMYPSVYEAIEKAQEVRATGMTYVAETIG